MPARKTKRAGAEVIKIVPRPHGLEAVYERHPDGTQTRTVRKVTTDDGETEGTAEEA